jgi:cbb3-type cytochrome oxidase subunit 3
MGLNNLQAFATIFAIVFVVGALCYIIYSLQQQNNVLLNQNLNLELKNDILTEVSKMFAIKCNITIS